MSEEKHTEFEFNEINIFTYLLSGMSKPIHQNNLYQKLKLIEESIPMHKSCKLTHIKFSAIAQITSK